jgi:chromosome segregation ATPase
LRKHYKKKEEELQHEKHQEINDRQHLVDELKDLYQRAESKAERFEREIVLLRSQVTSLEKMNAQILEDKENQVKNIEIMKKELEAQKKAEEKLLKLRSVFDEISNGNK